MHDEVNEKIDFCGEYSNDFSLFGRFDHNLQNQVKLDLLIVKF